ncbi:unnamed protein product, partial [Vitis vinifera]
MEDDYSSPARELLYMYCWKKPSSLSSRALNPQELCSSDRVTDTHPFGEETMETELMRLHDLSGPPRFLFTIKEETKEDLESEDGKSRVETPFLTPLASPPFFTPPLTPMDSSYNHQGVNPLFESAADADQFSKISSSPPPKFKFLKDAEEKLHRKVMEEAKKEQLQMKKMDRLSPLLLLRTKRKTSLIIQALHRYFLWFLPLQHSTHQLARNPSCTTASQIKYFLSQFPSMLLRDTHKIILLHCIHNTFLYSFIASIPHIP